MLHPHFVFFTLPLLPKLASHKPTMETFTSSLKQFSSPVSLPSSHIPLKVSAVRIEEKPPTQQQNPNYLKKQTPIPPPPLSATTTHTSTTSKERRSPQSGSRERRPQPQLSLPIAVCNAFDDIINTFLDSPPRPSVDPKHVLADNFAPVDELPPTECTDIDGALPPCLDGAYIRNGPNPRYLPRGPYHLFDGDGMLHALRISGGCATLCSRYVRTYKFNVEESAGVQIYPNFFSAFHGYTGIARGAVVAARALTGQFDPTKGAGVANTSLAFFGNKLFALGESDLPYEVRLSSDGEISTVGRSDFGGKLSMGMTAHPKIDPETGEVFAFRYGPVPPFLTFFRFDAAGSKQPDVPIFSVPRPSLLHDFAITKQYAVFADTQIVMNPTDMVLGGGSPVGADPAKVSRIGIIPRYAADESAMRWFDIPGFNMMHAINAWEEDDGDAVVMVAPNLVSVQHTLDRMHLLHCSVERIRLDLRTGHVKRTPVTVANLEFGVINPAYAGRRSRYAYMGIGDPMPKMSGLAKVDLEAAAGGDGVVARRDYGPGCFGGEPFFVAREPENPAAEEDDGYVVSFVHDDREGVSRFLVMDAKSPTLEVVASVRLPGRVPHGFHGLFVPERDLRKQQQWKD